MGIVRLDCGSRKIKIYSMLALIVPYKSIIIIVLVIVLVLTFVYYLPIPQPWKNGVLAVVSVLSLIYIIDRFF